MHGMVLHVLRRNNIFFHKILCKKFAACNTRVQVIHSEIQYFLNYHKNVNRGYSLEALSEALLMSTYKICFCGEIRKIL